jgi:tetratricopeptide (TPR) repeat protein
MRIKLSNNYVILFILLLFILAAYGNILNNELLWDDEVFIVENQEIRSFSSIPGFFFTPDKGGLYRPVKRTLLTLNFNLWGLNRWGYHLNSMVLHFFCTVLIFFISLKLFKKRNLAFLASIIFAVHPIHTERVTGVTASFDLLGIVFYLLAFFLYLLFREEGKAKFLYLSLFTFVLALLSSEEAITLPLVVLLYEAIFHHKRFWDNFRKEDVKSLFKRAWGYFFILGLYLIVRFLVLGRVARRNTYVTADFYSTMLTMSRVVVKYIGSLILPVNLSLNDSIPASTSIFDLRVIISLIIIVFILFLAFWQWSRNKLISFFIFWFFITLIPFYNIIPIRVLQQERYLYLASFSVCVLFSLLYCRMKKMNRILGAVFVVFLILFFTSATFLRNNDWQNEEILWEKTIQTSPDFPIAYNNLGMIYSNQGREEDALLLFRRAIELKGDYALAYNNIGKIYIGQDREEEALEFFTRAIELEPYRAQPYNNMGIIEKDKGNYELAIDYYQKAISLDSSYAEVYYNLGILYNDLEQYDDAIFEYNKSIGIRPSYAKAHNNLGVSLMNKGLIDEAIEEFKIALDIVPTYKEASDNLEFARGVKEGLKRGK